MNAADNTLLGQNAALKAALLAAETAGQEVAARLAVALAKNSEDAALIAAKNLEIARLKHQIYGHRSERSARLIEQMALQFEEAAANATEDELAAERAVAKTTTVTGFTRKPRERNTFPEHLPRERVVIEAPTVCGCCGRRPIPKRLKSVASAPLPSSLHMLTCRSVARLNYGRTNGSRRRAMPATSSASLRPTPSNRAGRFIGSLASPTALTTTALSIS